jgi:hypothetical protein
MIVNGVPKMLAAIRIGFEARVAQADPTPVSGAAEANVAKGSAGMKWSRRRVKLLTVVAVAVTAFVLALILGKRVALEYFCMRSGDSAQETMALRTKMASILSEDDLRDLIRYPEAPGIRGYRGNDLSWCVILGIKDTPKAHEILKQALDEADLRNDALCGLAFARSCDLRELYQRFEEDKPTRWILLASMAKANRLDAVPLLKDYLAKHRAEDPITDSYVESYLLSVNETDGAIGANN